ncbi:hypothetical protein ACFWMS_18110 [Peribacillus butanolivorans]|uniref:hypothetical protein n=1 Tax=Peribacillus butanolivorans TaxID=421767 RepID=UPI0036603102
MKIFILDESELIEEYAVTQVRLLEGTYFIKIDSSSSDDQPYEVKVGFTASNNYESGYYH